MVFRRGQIVKSLAGHDKEDFQVVITVEGNFATVCDGKRRSLERPKRKKLMHLAPTKTILNENKLSTNRQIRTALRDFSQSAD